MQRFQLSVTLMVTLVISTMFAGTSYAAPTQMRKLNADRPTEIFLVGNKVTLAPFAHVRFCARNPEDCAMATHVAASGGNVEHNIASLSRINMRVNNQMIARNDDAASGDVWDVDVASGDCEDFALTKRRALIKAGWPPASLRIAIALTSAGEGHAVLVATTTTGDVVLDNRTNQIKPWKKSGLRFTKIQSTVNPKAWLSL